MLRQIDLSELAALHGFIQLLDQCPFESTDLGFFKNAILFQEIIKTAARVRVDFSPLGHLFTPSNGCLQFNIGGLQPFAPG